MGRKKLNNAYQYFELFDDRLASRCKVCHKVLKLISLDTVCENCLRLVQECLHTGNLIRRFGYRNVCIPCGRSILRIQSQSVPPDSAEWHVTQHWIPSHQAERLDRVCMACWLRATRLAQKLGIREIKVENGDTPQSPPMPVSVTNINYTGTSLIRTPS